MGRSQRAYQSVVRGAITNQKRPTRRTMKTALRRRITASLTFAIVFVPWMALAQTSWKGTANSDWSNPGNWTAGVPSATVDAIIGDASFTGGNQPNLSTKSACKSLTIGAGSKASTLRVNKSFTVSGNLTIGPN